MEHQDSSIAAARAFAVRSHGDQRYGRHPYVVHLDEVAAILEPYGIDAQVAGYLHDTVEDTDATVEEVADQFGAHMGEVVGLLTDEEGANRKERKAKTYAKLAAVGPHLSLALIAKVGDRLGNVRACVRDGNAGLLAMYRGEHAAFRQAAYRPGLCDELWAELDRLLA
jgi:guanosine-3',5'-bis(diphosphate) 3'-pyrophosphohydrolase